MHSRREAGAELSAWGGSACLEGSERPSAFSSSCARSRLFCTMNCARSPTTLLLGVTCAHMRARGAPSAAAALPAVSLCCAASITSSEPMSSPPSANRQRLQNEALRQAAALHACRRCMVAWQHAG